MLTLVYKDFVVQRMVIVTYLAVTVLFAIQIISVDAPFVIVAMLAMAFTFASAGQDDRANSHLLLNSLPVTRQEIVTAKYVYHIASSLGLVGFAGIVRTLFSMMSPLTALYQTLITMAVIAWYLSVFFPMYYWLGPRFVQVGMIVFFISLFTAAPIVANMAVRHDFWGFLELIASLPAMPLYLLFTAVTLAALWASWRVSVWLYERKSF